MSMEIPAVAPESIVALLIGLVVDFDFAMRRLRGFGRHILAKLPQYDPAKEAEQSTETQPEDGS